MVRWKRGQTLTEVLAVIGVVSLLFSLVLPAVQAAREASRLAACKSNTRQVALAVHVFSDLNRVFPTNGLRRGTGDNATPFEISTWEKSTGELYRWGVGAPDVSPQRQPGSWCYSILPMLEMQGAYDNIAVESVITSLLCPSRGRTVAVPEEDGFGVYESAGFAWSKTDFCSNSLVSPSNAEPIAPSQVRDGLSATMWAGEKSIDPELHTPSTWYYDEPAFSGGSAGTSRRGVFVLPDSPGVRFKHNWGAAHRGGAVISLLDGSVRTLAFYADWRAVRALLTPAGGEILAGP